MKQKNILVVGGAGYIGSHVNKQLNEKGYQTIVYDNLSQGNRDAVTRGEFVWGEMGNPHDLQAVFSKYQIDAVMHFAALIDVGESVIHPHKYYTNNVANTLVLLEAMRQADVNYLIFSSTAAIFGNPQNALISESHPCNPINPYGRSKLMVEKILNDYDKAYGIRACCLRYFNAAGGDPDGEVKNYKKKESNLIPLILRAFALQQKVTIFGTDYPTPDGTCIRDYIHVNDLGTAHILAMEKLWEGSPSVQYNLGNGNGFSVREVLRAAEKVTGQNIKTIEGVRRPGDPPVLVADSTKARLELGWTPKYPKLETMIEHAWKAMALPSTKFLQK